MFQRLLLVFLLFGTALGGLLLPGCKPREEVLTSSGALEFSADTVKFDTVFTTLGTVTKRLWVYNRNTKAVNIDLINLDQPEASPYTLIINGNQQQTARNVYVRGQDSLLILVRAKLPDNGTNANPKNLVVQEPLHFVTNGNAQQVLLRSFGQNIFLHQDENLPCNAVWTNDRPHVLYGTVVVPTGCTLTIKPGTRIYAHAGAALLVNGSLRVNEPTDFAPTDTVKAGNRNIVRFTGDRQEAEYVTAPGQWTGIILSLGSHDNLLRYAQVQNAAVGILLANISDSPTRPDVQVESCVIRYISGSNVSFAGVASSLGLPGAGILNIGGDAAVQNTLFSDCYEYAVLNVGGALALNFCTIANYPSLPGPRKTQSLTMTNRLDVSDNAGTHTITYTQPALTVRNSIVWGSTDEELFFDNADAYRSAIQVQHSLLRTKTYSAATDAAGKPGLANPTYGNILNQDPLFVRPAAGGTNDDYRLTEKSLAWHLPNPVGTVPAADLLHLPRSQTTPSLGAYEGTK